MTCSCGKEYKKYKSKLGRWVYERQCECNRRRSGCIDVHRVATEGIVKRKGGAK